MYDIKDNKGILAQFRNEDDRDRVFDMFTDDYPDCKFYK